MTDGNARPCGYVPVCLECDGIFMILFENAVAHVLARRLQEHLGLNGVDKVIANANTFDSSRAFCT
jgi:hypothetical protein